MSPDEAGAGVRFRSGRPEDHAALLGVYGQARYTPPTPERLARVRTKLSTELLVVADDEGLVGFALGEPERRDQGRGAVVPGGLHLSMLFVLTNRRGEGLGTGLVEGLADRAWAEGYRTVSVWSSTPGFYQACGFTATEQTQVLPDGRPAVRLTAELEAPVRELVLAGPGIRLGQLLKFAGLVDTGADAKALLAVAGVEVNGEVDTRRGRQLHDGDEIRALGQAIVVRLPAAD